MRTQILSAMAVAAVSAAACGTHQRSPACDDDGIGDARDPSFADFDAIGIPDYRECIAGPFVDGLVNGIDLGYLLSQWGACTN